MALYYFTRSSDPDPFAAKFLVSGVIEAETMDAAAKALDEALERTRNADRSSSFIFIALDGAEKGEGGLLAITMGDR